jgi:hypothetical protein
MSAIGKRGFAAIATFPQGGRAGALSRLAAWGKIKPRRNQPELTPSEMDDLFREVGYED